MTAGRCFVLSTMQSTFLDQLPPQLPAERTPVVHTGNKALAKAAIFSDRFGSPLVSIALDGSLADNLWILFVGGRPVGPARKITLAVGSEIRKAIEKHQGRK